MDNENVVTTGEESVVAQVAEAVVSDDAVDTGHKIGFYIILGLIGLSGVGIPILVFLLVKEHKKRKQLEDALNGKTTEVPAAEEAKATEEVKPEATPEKKK